MYKSNVKSEQITKSGIILDDKGEILSDTELSNIRIIGTEIIIAIKGTV